MNLSPCYAKKQIPMPAGVWTPVIVPIDCNYFALKSGSSSSFKFRTDKDDPTTEDSVSGGTQEALTSAQFGALFPVYSGAPVRFRAGKQGPGYVQPSGEADDVLVGTFVL